MAVDGTTATVAGAILGAGGTIGALVSRAIRWAARVHRSTVEASQEIIRDNTAAMREFAQALGRIDGGVTAIARERSGVTALPDLQPDPPARDTTREDATPPARRFPRAESQPKKGR